MQTDVALDRLRHHQEALAALLDEAGALLGGDPDAARLPLATLRWALARKAREYQFFKHLEIFDPAIAGDRPAQAAEAAAMKHACVTLAAELDRYVRRWAGCDLVAAWPACRSETAALTLRLRRHLLAERQGVKRLLAGCARTRGPA